MVPEGAEYVAVNRANWDERVPAHVASPDYAVERFLKDPSFLSGVVSFDVPLLGDVRGQEALHLQCHIGTDTLSLARLGAHMSGLDFSEPALAQARELAQATGAEIDYVCAEVYDAPQALGEGRFELLYTGIGALCWMPDIDRWAEVVSRLLAPGGRLFIREGHPMLWAIDETRPDGLLVVDLPYFERAEALVWTAEGTYVQTEENFEHNITHVWNHGLAETMDALQRHGMRITAFAEHDSAPWDALPGRMERLGSGEYRLRERCWRLPLTYTLQAIKESPAG